jgi:hypothetical protein
MSYLGVEYIAKIGDAGIAVFVICFDVKDDLLCTTRRRRDYAWLWCRYRAPHPQFLTFRVAFKPPLYNRPALVMRA